MLYFWTTSCPCCRETEPRAKALRERYAREDLEILAINVGDSQEKTK
jgi:thiol-disulfide isomerase/thioredoxin